MSPLTDLVDAVQRRWIIRQLIEFAAVGMAIGSAVSISLIGIQLTRNQSAISIAVSFSMLGLFSGVMVAMRRLPARMDVVEKLDQAAGDDNLLSTAWLLSTIQSSEQWASDPWKRGVISIANATAASLHPSAVLTRRIGKRGWSTIVVLTSTASVLAAISVFSKQTIAAVSTAPSAAATAGSWTHWTSQALEEANATAPSSSIEATPASPVNSSCIDPEQPPDLRFLNATENARNLKQQTNRDSAGFGESHSNEVVMRVQDWTTQSGSTESGTNANAASSQSNPAYDDNAHADRIGRGTPDATAQNGTENSVKASQPVSAETAERKSPYRMLSIYKEYFSAKP